MNQSAVILNTEQTIYTFLLSDIKVTLFLFHLLLVKLVLRKQKLTESFSLHKLDTF